MTNQASEDELQARIDQLYIDTGRSKGSPRITPRDFDRHIKTIIRTEKLKLLAEVRERVIGEDEPGVTNIMIAAEHAKQRNVLTKLEAEL